MSILKTIMAQLGISAAPANNFTLDASADDGTMKLARGNAGAPTQDIITIDANGKMLLPQATSLDTTPMVALARGAFGLGAQNAPAITGDLGSVPGSGFYSYSPANASRPTGSDHGMLLHLGLGTGSGGNWAQICLSTSGTSGVHMFFRTLTNGAYSPWKQVTSVDV